MAWAYPRIVAHRGGGNLAPENTLGGLRRAAALGFRAVEFDVMLAAGGVPVVIHDETTDRTTGVRGRVPAMTVAQLANLDAGDGEGVPTFESAALLCRKLGLWANVEIKPAAGQETATGETVARLARELWRGAEPPPLLSSFSVVSLLAAQEAAPELPRGGLCKEIPENWEATLKRLGCISLHASYRALTEEQVRAVRGAGYGLACWTVDDPQIARRLLGWGADCLITDALGVIGPDFA